MYTLDAKLTTGQVILLYHLEWEELTEFLRIHADHSYEYIQFRIVKERAEETISDG